jgi:penicillin-binding protein-related factor A (putative recombinase)
MDTGKENKSKRRSPYKKIKKHEIELHLPFTRLLLESQGISFFLLHNFTMLFMYSVSTLYFLSQQEKPNN